MDKKSKFEAFVAGAGKKLKDCWIVRFNLPIKMMMVSLISQMFPLLQKVWVMP